METINVTNTRAKTERTANVQSDNFVPRYTNLLNAFDVVTARQPAAPLFGVKTNGQWKWSTYGEFKDAVGKTRRGLRALGVEANDRVAVISNNRPEWAIGEYATWGLGAAYVPMYESQSVDEQVYILKDCAAKVCFIATAKGAAALEARRNELPNLTQIITFDSGSPSTFAELQSRGSAADVTQTVDPDSIACFIYTSGTTGKPKGVKLSHRNVASNVSSALLECFDVVPGDRSLSFLPWAHCFGQICELHALIASGASMAIAEAVDKIIDNLGEVRPSILLAVPRIFNRIYDRMNKQINEGGAFKRAIFKKAVANAARRKALKEEGRTSATANFMHNAVYDKLVFSKVRDRFGGQLKYAISGGAALSKEVAEFIDNIGITVYEGYGLSETSPVATVNTPAHRKIGTVGPAIPGVRIEIDYSASTEPHHGEIIVHGHAVMQGYHNLPAEDEAVFTKDGGFRTGDLGFLDDKGFLTISGRIKEQYKLETGKYVAPAPLEELIKLSPFIASAFVFGDNRPYNVALIVPEFAELESWAKGHGLPSSKKELLNLKEVKDLIAAELKNVSRDFKAFETIKKFRLIDEDFTQENGMLTPKLSLKRRNVIDRYKGELEALYEN